MKYLTVIFLLLIFPDNIKAESFYCWAIDGLNIRKTPSSTGMIVGKIKYGERIDINLQLTDFSNDYEELFLIGEKEDKSADLKFSGSWYYIDFKEVKGYIFGGYLSRYPPFEIKRLEDEINCESLNEYLIRNFSLLNHSKSEFDSSYYDNKYRTFTFKEGIMLVNGNSDLGQIYNIIFSEMTLNEALLFIKFDFNLLKPEPIFSRNNLDESEHYYGKLVSDERIEINFPAPSGGIIIMKIGASIIISVYGSC
jgi:hypothetical protein